ncbi:MAG: tRNA (adenosine(37)-N6)-threonylcarbamoyltransferase complex ATPase subunit type 1 TsaE [Clostridia bacterium]
MKIYTTKSAQETRDLGKTLAKDFIGGETVLLSGDLGAGKTVLSKGIADALGITDEVTSPTFALHNSYDGKLTLNHFDFYRISDEEEVRILGLDEYFGQTNSVSVIEWWSNIKSLLPKKCIIINILRINDNEREIEVI